LPQGEHQVEFVYFPLSFKLGLSGTFLTIVTILGCSIKNNFMKRRDISLNSE